MGSAAHHIDRVLAWLKWPVAAAALAFLPGLAVALGRVARVLWADPRPPLAFLAGAGGFLLVWLLLLRRWSVGRFLVTLEHELTHALVAWGTLHRVVGFRASLRGGGHVRFVGRGNWLISIAPYFVPTLALAALAVLLWLPDRHLAAGSAALGAALAYHAVSTWTETHAQQSDLREVGFLFSALFLPSANAALVGLVLAVACGVEPGSFLAWAWESTADLAAGLAGG